MAPADAPPGSVETWFAPIHSAARLRDCDAVRQELNAGVDVDLPNGDAANGDGGNTPLWFAAQGPADGGPQVARVLLNAGARVNRACKHGRTALHMAAAWGHLEMVRLLVEYGAETAIRDVNGQTPRQLAAESQRVPRILTDAVVDFLT